MRSVAVMGTAAAKDAGASGAGAAEVVGIGEGSAAEESEPSGRSGATGVSAAGGVVGSAEGFSGEAVASGGAAASASGSPGSAPEVADEFAASPAVLLARAVAGSVPNNRQTASSKESIRFTFSSFPPFREENAKQGNKKAGPEACGKQKTKPRPPYRQPSLLRSALHFPSPKESCNYKVS